MTEVNVAEIDRNLLAIRRSLGTKLANVVSHLHPSSYHLPGWHMASLQRKSSLSRLKRLDLGAAGAQPILANLRGLRSGSAAQFSYPMSPATEIETHGEPLSAP